MGCPPTGVKAKDAARLGFDLARCLVDEDAPAGLEAAPSRGQLCHHRR